MLSRPPTASEHRPRPVAAGVDPSLELLARSERQDERLDRVVAALRAMDRRFERLESGLAATSIELRGAVDAISDPVEPTLAPVGCAGDAALEALSNIGLVEILVQGGIVVQDDLLPRLEALERAVAALTRSKAA